MTNFFIKSPASGNYWMPVGFSGDDEGGRVTASKIFPGHAHSCYREYSSRKAARAAAVRLIRRLEKAQTVEEHNRIVESWYGRD